MNTDSKKVFSISIIIQALLVVMLKKSSQERVSILFNYVKMEYLKTQNLLT